MVREKIVLQTGDYSQHRSLTDPQESGKER
jgi:hypothetical protein